MISYLKGEIIIKKKNFIILRMGGVGFKVFLAGKRMKDIKKEAELFSYLDVNERSLKLFGFLNYRELKLFELVREVSGVGPKAALEISSLDSPEKVEKEIRKGNEKIFKNISGIGPKKARKIILEISGKLSSKKDNFPDEEAFDALKNLGFKKKEIEEALERIPEGIEDKEEKLKEALKVLGK